MINRNWLCCGLELQEVYYTLVEETEEKTFTECVQILDGQFATQINITFERHLFRQLEQKTNESVDQFVSRLRMKTATCQFENEGEAIRDQLIDKCKNPSLRRKFLEKLGDVTLTDLQMIARAHEAVDAQMKTMEQQEQVNVVKTQRDPKPRTQEHFRDGKKKYSPKARPGEKNRCYRCNSSDHFARDKDCPARDKTCGKCGFKGHMSTCCKTKIKESNRKQKTYHISENEHASDYMFNVDHHDNRTGKVDLNVGGIFLKAVIIDSGATCNVIDEKTWENMKKQGIECVSKKSCKKLYAYGQKEPFQLLGSFTARTHCDVTGKCCDTEFTVAKVIGSPILEKETAENLDVLRVGPPMDAQIYSLTQEGDDEDINKRYPRIFEGVGKFKYFQLKLHINEEMKPIAQQVRRIPFGLREKVSQKLDDLLDKDILERVQGTPTTWISPLVVVPKPDSDIRVCVDMRRANDRSDRKGTAPNSYSGRSVVRLEWMHSFQ